MNEARYSHERDTGRVDGLAGLSSLGHWLDDLIRLPGGYRIGLDGIIGLIPGFGDAAGAVLSSVIIAQAARLGVPNAVLLRMIGNVLLDTVVGAIPILGDLFDIAWKANLRNLELLRHHRGRASAGERGSQRLSWVILTVVLLAVLAVLALVYFALALLFELIAAI